MPVQPSNARTPMCKRARAGRLLLAALIAGGAFALSRPSATIASSPASWPTVYHQAGAEYIGTNSEVDAAAALGLTLGLGWYTDPSSSLGQEFHARGVKYLDRSLWDLILNACGSSFGNCTISSSQESQILSAAQQHLALVGNDPDVAGYYILDDYPGNIMPTLEALTNLVHQANQSLGMQRPTVCGFGVTLDWEPSPGAPYNQSHSQWDQAIANYSPSACDIPDVYAYGVGFENGVTIPPSQTDWTGANLIPYLKQTLQAKGWDPASGFIETPQTFHFGDDNHDASPTAANITTETASFCAAGAIATLAFAWDATSDPTREMLYNTPDYQTGFQAGNQQCQTMWGSPAPTSTATAVATTPVVPTATNTPIVPTATDTPSPSATASPTASASPTPTGPRRLRDLFNNPGSSVNNVPGAANFDAVGYSYSTQALSSAGLNAGQVSILQGTTFRWPDGIGTPNNIVAQGQTISLGQRSGSTLSFLGAADHGPSVGTATITYGNGSTQQFQLGFSDWTLNAGTSQPSYGNSIVATTSYRNTSNGSPQTIATDVFSASVPLVPGTSLASLTLPSSVSQGHLHIFAISLD